MDGSQDLKSTSATSESLTHQSTRDEWVAYMRACLVRNGRAQDAEQGTRQTYGRRLSLSCQQSDPGLFSLKMYPDLSRGIPLSEQIWDESDTPLVVRSSPTLPEWARHTLAHATGPLPAPTATANQWCPSMRKHPGCKRLQILFPGGAHPRIWEWMMAFPIGWTGLRLRATVKSRSKRRVPGAS
jgi:hypothetical protein